MEPKNYTKFPSKILLFGEYLILHGGNALAIPYHPFSLSRSTYPVLRNKPFYKKIENYILSKDILKHKLSSNFSRDIDLGLNYESNIPIGYGLGSSGALVAAIYQEYFCPHALDMNLLQLELAEIESFFHSKSSGIDPLTSFVDKPIYTSKDGIVTLNEFTFAPFELYDSGIRRNAKKAIEHFKILSKDFNFLRGMERLKEISNAMIEKWIQHQSITEEMEEYSKLQLLYFRDFIPEKVTIDWKFGIDNQLYYMKICGAGMGGMYLKYQLG